MATPMRPLSSQLKVARLKASQAKKAGEYTSKLIEAIEALGFEVEKFYAEEGRVDLTVKYPKDRLPQGERD